MRLLSHNVLRNTAKGVTEGFPLRVEASDVKVVETEPDVDFIKGLLGTISWPALRLALENLGLDASVVPAEVTDAMRHDAALLKALHSMLLDVHVMEGTLICPESGRRFPVANGIVNMMLTEEELT